MMKRVLALLVALTLLLGCAVAETAVEAEAAVPQIEMKAFPLYLCSPNEMWPEEFPLYFLDGVYDLPYVDLRDWAEVLNWYFPTKGGGLYDDYQITVNIYEEHDLVMYDRENGSSTLFHFHSGEISWTDYMGFMQQTVGAYMDISCTSLRTARAGPTCSAAPAAGTAMARLRACLWRTTTS